MTFRHCRIRLLIASLALLVVLASVGFGTEGQNPRHSRHRSLLDLVRLPCVYTAAHISVLEAFSSVTGRSFRCAVVYSNSAPNWAAWSDPWFLTPNLPDVSWGKWATEPGTDRLLIIGLSLFPLSLNHRDWLDPGAAGAFTGEARALASNLVRAGLGYSVINLGSEANGTWEPYSVPATVTGDALWVRFWRKTVQAMRSVPGAHFLFDWTVNPGYRPLPLQSFYPGNDVVDIIGVDAYDANALSPSQHSWSAIYHEADGLGVVLAFATDHGKPLSLPEWGLMWPRRGGIGDDPAYIDGIAAVVKHTNIAFQAYFYVGEFAAVFANSPASETAYRQHFGAQGDAIAPTMREGASPAVAQAATLVVTAGPANGSVTSGASVAFSFQVKAGLQPECSLDGARFAPCTTSDTSVLHDLQFGYHIWQVRAIDSLGRMAVVGRTFTVAD